MMLTVVLGIAATTSHNYIISFIRTLPEDAGNFSADFKTSASYRVSVYDRLIVFFLRQGRDPVNP